MSGNQTLKQRRLRSVLDEREAERLDRIRNPDNIAESDFDSEIWKVVKHTRGKFRLI